MKARTVKATVLLLALALLMAGCSFSKRSTAIRRADRSTVQGAQLEALKNENAEMRKKQKRNEVKIAQLEKMLASTQKEQQRFQRTMRSNFDMMEQSVALTLSKRVTGEVARTGSPIRPPKRTAEAMRPVRSSSDRRVSRPARPAMARQAPPAGKKAANPVRRPVLKPSPEKRNMPPSLAEKSSAAPTRINRVAMEAPKTRPPLNARPSIAVDADLSAPADPRKLSTHPPAKRLYEKGFALFAQKDFSQSILVFRNFLNRFPNDFYSDNAQFWIGESHRYLNQPEKAEQAYRQVLRNYEHKSTLEGYKTPDAMYRLGQKFNKARRFAQARQFFQTLAERFPDTSAGRRARNELSMLQMKTAANH
ncbi:MAG: tetratricopeptide repeat protein [bacterium]